MAMDLLKQLAASPLPAYLHSPEDIDKLRLLQAAGLVQAIVPADLGQATPDGAWRGARVAAITPKGREALQEAGGTPAQAVRTAPDHVTRRMLDALERLKEGLK